MKRGKRRAGVLILALLSFTSAVYLVYAFPPNSILPPGFLHLPANTVFFFLLFLFSFSLFSFLLRSYKQGVLFGFLIQAIALPRFFSLMNWFFFFLLLAL